MLMAPIALRQMHDEARPDAMVEHRERLRAVLGLDLLHLLGDDVERLAPGNRLPLFLAALADADQRGAQAIRVIDGADRPGAARAQPAAALRVERIAFELPELAVAHVGDAAAAPEAHFAERRDCLHFARRRRARGGDRGAAGSDRARQRHRPARWQTRSAGSGGGKRRGSCLCPIPGRVFNKANSDRLGCRILDPGQGGLGASSSAGSMFRAGRGFVAVDQAGLRCTWKSSQCFVSSTRNCFGGISRGRAEAC